MPRWLLKPLARIYEWRSFITGKEPEITPEHVHLFSMDVSFNCTKAERELGYRETSLARMVEDTYAWLVAEKRI
jgi:nucleoside-diphosphate-sugar epimerase